MEAQEYEKLVEALRHCVSDEKGVTKCAGCPYYPDITGCMDRLHTEAADAIEALQAQLPKRGEWVEQDDGDSIFHKCSVCGKNQYNVLLEMMQGEYHYCPNCGAKMEVQE